MKVAAGLTDVSVRLGGSLILDGVSLRVAQGEFVSLLGPSGSGKTTSLNVLAGFIQPVTGDVILDDEIVNAVPPPKRDVGFVFQNYALFPHMSVAENIGFPLRVRRTDKRGRDAAIAASLELVQLVGMDSRPVGSLSGGQQQRVALARALCFKPRVLLLDEPLAALDKQLRSTMQLELARIQREVGVTTLAVTHDQVEALTMADRVVILRDGRIEQEDTPEEVYRRPATLFVARFLGEANIVPVDSQGSVRGWDLRLPGQRGGVAVIRPEDIVVRSPRVSESLDGVSAIVEDVHFQGTQYRLVARLGGLPDPIVAFLGAVTRAPAPGDRVALQLDEARVHVIAEPHARSLAASAEAATSSA